MPKYVCKRCGKEMFSLTEVVEDWDDIYCKGCDPDWLSKQQASVHSSAANTPPRSSSSPAERSSPAGLSIPRAQGGWRTAAHGADVPLMFLVKGRRWRAAPESADAPPLARPSWDAERAVAALDITEVLFEATDNNMLGYARGRTIAVSPTNPLPHHTRFHELAHVLLGHTTESDQPGGELTPRNLRECEAEAVAMLCCAALDLPGVAFSGRYIQGWWGSGKIPKRSAQRIRKVVDQILTAGAFTAAADEDRS